MSQLKQLIAEIHRRSLWQVLLIYIAASWVVLEVADVLVDRLALPEWVYGAAMVLLLVGLPIVLATAFVQEGIAVAARHDPTLLPGAGFEPGAAPRRSRGAGQLFTWRNAITGGALAFGLWGVVATGGALFGDRAGQVEAGTVGDSLTGPGSSFDAGKLVVAPFENRSGDVSIDDYGRLAAASVTRGISRSGVVEPVPMSAVREFWQSGEKAKTPTVRALAQHTGATAVVSGTYSVFGERLRFQAEIVDAGSGDLIAPLDPVSGPADSVDAVIGVLTDRVVAAVAVHFAPVSGSSGPERFQAISTLPPNLEAFREFEKGHELLLRSQPAAALAHFERALEIDPTNPAPVLQIAVSYYNDGQVAKADSVLTAARGLRDRMTVWERAVGDWYLAWVQGDLDAEYRASKEILRLNPRWAGAAQSSAARNNRPAEAVQISEEGAPLLDDSEWDQFWRAWSGAHHRLGQHSQELDVARDARERFPELLRVLNAELIAQAALGNLDEVDRLIEESLSKPPPGPGASMRLAGLELRAHGHSEAARSMMDRAIAWFEAQRSSEDAAALESEYAQTLYVAGRWDEAKALYETLALGSPDNVEYMGYLGVIAARQGDEATAQRISDDLAKLVEDRKYLRGIHTRWRARIAAVLDEPEAAVARLRQAIAEGVPYTLWIHTDIDFEPLRDDPRFQELVRPKG